MWPRALARQPYSLPAIDAPRAIPPRRRLNHPAMKSPPARLLRAPIGSGAPTPVVGVPGRPCARRSQRERARRVHCAVWTSFVRSPPQETPHTREPFAVWLSAPPSPPRLATRRLPPPSAEGTQERAMSASRKLPSSKDDAPYMTTNSGAPVFNNQSSFTVGDRCVRPCCCLAVEALPACPPPRSARPACAGSS